MPRVSGAAILTIAKDEASLLLSLDHTVMVRGADAFELAFPEEDGIALMSDAVVGDRCGDCQTLSKAALA
ncbi:hypothetical protein BLM15_07625 [Bosea sp. Tri-49]|nr:hypothetical protein BLM15_07625 [Bosea sp. Tri-49]